MNTKIWVIAHKKYSEPKDEMYETLHVGRALSENLGYQGDDTGDSISEKNKNYCELTGMYWLWKNYDCDIIGICHYRRFFIENERLLTKAYIEKTLESYDIIAARNGAVEYDTVRQQYDEKHYGSDMDVCRKVIVEKYPSYVNAFDVMQDSRLMNYCNMLIARKEIYDEYCNWLFDILFEVEKRIDISDRDDYQKRVMGFLSERLFKVWLIRNHYKVKEQPVKMMNADEIDKHFEAQDAVKKLVEKITGDIAEKYANAGIKQDTKPDTKSDTKAETQIDTRPEIKSEMETENRAENTVKKIPVWMCWWQGEENAPQMVKRCIDSVKRNIDSNKCELHIITLENCQNYVTFSPQIIEKFNAGNITLTTLSDRLRMELLYRYGGLWIDATYYVADSRIMSVIEKEGFFTQKLERAVWDDDVSKGRWACNLLKTDAGFPLFGFIVDAYDKYYTYMDKSIDYFLTDYFINAAYEKIPEVRRAIDSCSTSNPDVFFLNDNEDRIYNDEEWKRVLKNTWLFKLNRRKEYRTCNIINQNTYYGEIIGN